MGSGGMIVVDDDTCMVEFAKYFLTFASAESCGKCVPCRVGGQRMLEVLTRITEGKGTMADVQTIRDISAQMQADSLCALGQLTPGPVMAALRFFGQEFVEHIEDKTCKAGQCKNLVRAKCINACPADVESPAYLALVSQGKFAEGLAVHRERNPFPLICGRVCPAFCEEKCRRGEIDEPIAIRSVKRFMADAEAKHPWTPEPVGPEATRKANAKKKVAVVGAGPAGLTAALRLAQRGYKVTVLEKLPVPGGMMTVGIPEYRLPREPLFAEIESIARAGVKIECNKALGRDYTVDSLLEKYNAVVLAIGAHVSRKLGIPGEELAGVVHGTDFLREIGLSSVKDTGVSKPGKKVAGKRIAVVGGGDVAIDAARSAWRLGASEVHIIYRRQRQDMPAHKEEIEAAMHEGVQFHFLANPVKVLGEKHVTGVTVQRQRLGEFDSSGRRRPVAIEDDEFDLDIDVLVPAIGQTTDAAPFDGSSVELTKGNTFKVAEALNTTQAGVFAAGDAVSGPWTVIGAVAQGNQVAVAVDEWLQNGKLAKPHYVTPRRDIVQLTNMDDYADAHRPSMPELSVAERSGNFREVELGYDEKIACEEAKRCLRCDLEWMDWMGIARPQVAAASEQGQQQEKGG
jgi:NADH-quinone oxidoreductase subunit F